MTRAHKLILLQTISNPCYLHFFKFQNYLHLLQVMVLSPFERAARSHLNIPITQNHASFMNILLPSYQFSSFHCPHIYAHKLFTFFTYHYLYYLQAMGLFLCMIREHIPCGVSPQHKITPQSSTSLSLHMPINCLYSITISTTYR